MKLMVSEAPVLPLIRAVYFLSPLRTLAEKIPIDMNKISTGALLLIPWNPRSGPLRSALPSPTMPDPPLYPLFQG